MLIIAGAAFAVEPGAEAESTGAENEETYVVREEKVVNLETGKVEAETVIEFPELEILPELARPVTIIIPRTKPDFDDMPFTIYNNEPPSYVPDEYKYNYYRRVPLGEEGLGGVKTGDMFEAPAPEEESSTAADD
jgi:hypothetical protein